MKPMLRRLFGVACAKWIAVSLCALVIAAWLASRWYFGYVIWSKAAAIQIVLSHGELGIYRINPAPGFCPAGLSGEVLRCEPEYVGWRWRPVEIRMPPWKEDGQRICVALYIPFAILVATSVVLFSGKQRADQSKKNGECLKCGYDLKGTSTISLCPECGSKTGK